MITLTQMCYYPAPKEGKTNSFLRVSCACKLAGIPGSRHTLPSRQFLAGTAGVLPLAPLLRPPLRNQERDVPELNDPDGDIRCHGELVIENGTLIHDFP